MTLLGGSPPTCVVQGWSMIAGVGWSLARAEER